MLAFIAGKFDMTFPTDVSVPLLKNIRHDAPKALCTMRESGVSVNLIINREAPPFDNPKIRRALALTLDRKAFIDIISEGEDKTAGIMLPPPDGGWGMTPEMLKDLPGYGDVAQAREEAAQADAGGGLRARQAAQDQGQHAQHRHLQGPGGDPDRPAEAGLCRRRARDHRHRASTTTACSRRTTWWR